MLQFWRKSGSREEKRSPSSSPPPTKPFVNAGLVNGIQQPASRLGPLASIEDEGLFDLCENDIPKQRSRLSKTLDEVLDDKMALGYFAQFLEARGGLSHIHCWFDVEQFKSDAEKAQESTAAQTIVSAAQVKTTDHDSLSVSTDCDSFTADSYSLCDYSLSEAKSSTSDVKLNCDENNDTSQVNLVCESSIRNKTIQRMVDEAVRIFKTYISLEANESIQCPEGLRNEVVENICNSKVVDCFKQIEKYAHDTLEKEYFNAFLGSDYFCKHQIDVLTSGNIILDDILYNETALFYFMEFLEQENNRSLLEFWIAASNFQMQLTEQKDFFDPMEAQSDAVVLYDKYFSLQAHCPLGFSDKIRFAVEQNICGENGIMLDCFHLPLKIVEQVLERNYLRPFAASQLFYKYLSELINSVSSSVNGSQDKYSPSECSSEKSFSTNSTFLAMHIPKAHQKKERGSDMHIDVRQLYDPDSLWKRKKHHRLSLGRVTALGKYETDFEPEPDTRVASRLKNAVKRFVTDEERKKEEMAWQVAEMIVKDITNITLNDQKDFPAGSEE